MSDFTGYAIDQEERDELHAEALDFNVMSLSEFDDTPIKYDPTDWWITENQGGVGRCAGMASSSTGEMCYKLQTGKIIQFNGHYSYIRAQQKSKGLYGRDAGSTMYGNMLAAKEHGFCPMDWDKDGTVDYPLPPRYTTDIPAQADTYASKYKIKFHLMLKDWDSMARFIRLGMGAIMVGAGWGNWGPNAQGLITNFSDGGGGHAWLINGWDFSRTVFHEDVLIMFNSHGKRWGINGKAYLTRRFVEGMLKSRRTEVIGMSDLTTPEPRKIDWSKQWLLG